MIEKNDLSKHECSIEEKFLSKQELKSMTIINIKKYIQSKNMKVTKTKKDEIIDEFIQAISRLSMSDNTVSLETSSETKEHHKIVENISIPSTSNLDDFLSMNEVCKYMSSITKRKCQQYCCIGRDYCNLHKNIEIKMSENSPRLKLDDFIVYDDNLYKLKEYPHIVVKIHDMKLPLFMDNIELVYTLLENNIITSDHTDDTIKIARSLLISTEKADNYRESLVSSNLNIISKIR